MGGCKFGKTYYLYLQVRTVLHPEDGETIHSTTCTFRLEPCYTLKMEKQFIPVFNKCIRIYITSQKTIILISIRYIIYQKIMYIKAEHCGRAVYGMNYLRPLDSWDRKFESHSMYECVSAFIECFYCSVCR
jgi:hypothetical protein